MPRSKLAAYKQQLRAAEEDVQHKAQQLDELKEQVALARSKIDKLESEVDSNAALEDDVQTLLRCQQQTAAAFTDYENRVLALELQGLVDRWRTMDIEDMAQQNHDLREECMRLQNENMDLSRAVAENSLSARRDLAKIEMALELTVKEKMHEMHERLRQELYDEMDDKTKKMVAEHGHLQDYVRDQAAQAATLDRHYRLLQAERTRFKVDSDVAISLSEQQASQSVGLRRQLKQAYQVVEMLQRRLVESEAKAQAAWDEAVRASSRAAIASAAAARAGLHSDVDGDSAYGMAGDSAEVAALESQLRHAKQRFERMRLQRDRWRDRSMLYEKACAQLQAALQTLQDQARMTLPGGVKQDLDAIWCAAKAADAAADGGWGSRPSTAHMPSRPSTPCIGGGGDAGKGDWRVGMWNQGFSSPNGVTAGGGGNSTGGGAGWPVGAGSAAAGAARARAASARVSGAAGARAAGLPVRPLTAAPPSSGGGAAARRTAEAIRAAVNISPAPAPPTPVTASPGDMYGGGGGAGAGPGPESAWGEDDAAAARGSTSPLARVPVSRLYSAEAEPYKVVPRVQYDQVGWPTVPEIRPLSPDRAASIGTPSGRPSTAQLVSSAAAVSPLNAMAAPPGGVRRTPGSMRPHSAVEPSPAATPRWTIGMSLTGLTSSPSGTPAAAADAASASDEPSPAGPTDAKQDEPRLQPRLQGQLSSPGNDSGIPGTPTAMRPSLRMVQHAAEADWQSWQAQRERSQSPECAAIARSAAASAAAAAPASGTSGAAAAEQLGARLYGIVRDDDAWGRDRAASAAAPLGQGSTVPEVGMSGGALYAAVHTIAVSAGGAAGAGTGSALPSISPGGAAVGLYSQYGGQLPASAGAAPARAPQAGASPPGAEMTGNPSALLAALRRPPSSFKRLHNPDVMFSGVRATSAKVGAGGLRSQGSGAAGGAISRAGSASSSTTL